MKRPTTRNKQSSASTFLAQNAPHPSNGFFLQRRKHARPARRLAAPRRPRPGLQHLCLVRLFTLFAGKWDFGESSPSLAYLLWAIRWAVANRALCRVQILVYGRQAMTQVLTPNGHVYHETDRWKNFLGAQRWSGTGGRPLKLCHLGSQHTYGIFDSFDAHRPLALSELKPSRFLQHPLSYISNLFPRGVYLSNLTIVCIVSPL